MRKRPVKKNPLITFAIGLFFLAIVALQVILVDPGLVKDLLLPSAYLTISIPLFLALFFLLGAFLKNIRRSLTASIVVVIFLYLRVSGFGTLLNLLLLAGIVISLEFYFHSQQKDKFDATE